MNMQGLFIQKSVLHDMVSKYNLLVAMVLTAIYLAGPQPFSRYSIQQALMDMLYVV